MSGVGAALGHLPNDWVIHTCSASHQTTYFSPSTPSSHCQFVCGRIHTSLLLPCWSQVKPSQATISQIKPSQLKLSQTQPHQNLLDSSPLRYQPPLGRTALELTTSQFLLHLISHPRALPTSSSIFMFNKLHNF